ncbi:MAG: hypothetical protein JXA25_20465 [Anaerolineales bacterium]|nr:hypothetical protein [Anaerolineales bacterium]
MKFSYRIHLSASNYATMMAGAGLICLYNAATTLIISGFNYHVLTQTFLGLYVLYTLWSNNETRECGWDIEIFFILMAAITVLALAGLGIGSWIFFQGSGFRLRSEYAGLFIMLGLYCTVLSFQVLKTLLLAKKATRKSRDFNI